MAKDQLANLDRHALRIVALTMQLRELQYCGAHQLRNRDTGIRTNLLLPNEEKIFVARPNKSLSTMTLISLSRNFSANSRCYFGKLKANCTVLHDRCGFRQHQCRNPKSYRS